MSLVYYSFIYTLLGRLTEPASSGIPATLAFAAAVLTISFVLRKNSTRFMHLLQLDSYQLDGYKRSLKRNGNTDIRPLLYIVLFSALIESLVFLAGTFIKDQLILLLCVTVFALFMLLSLRHAKKRNSTNQKKPFVVTERIKRLKIAFIIIAVIVSMLAAAVSLGAAVLSTSIIGVGTIKPRLVSAIFFFVSAVILYLPVYLVPYLVYFAAKLREAPERKINESFKNDARRIIDSRPELIVVGITGSYGKTSTKFILGEILKTKYNVLVPPASYNTPMGLTRAVREMLEPSHEVFIAEMGARRVGEINELCDIVKPRYGILTSIGSQHLETFGSIENIANTKFELAQSLPDSGVAFFPEDGAYCSKLYSQYAGNKRNFGFGEGLYMSAQNVKVGPEGSSFELVCNDGGRVMCRTKLLGRHNVMNILGCAACAREIGLEMNEIAAGIERVRPVEHRLQLIDGGTGVIVIDDAFNSNPEGTKAAMEVLAMFEGRKICVTPGMVELGVAEQEENRKFGERMASVCDIVILVGRRHTEPIREGLIKAGFSADNILTAANLNEATAILSGLTKPGDVVLFENDLPDNYEEN